MRIAFAIAISLFLLCWPTFISIPGSSTYVVQSGESLSMLAKRYYGHAWKFSYIMAANRIEDHRKVIAGASLKFPESTLHKVNSGESLSRIAKRYFGDGKSYHFIAWANGLKPNAALKVGQKLVIPFVVDHKVRQNDSLQDIASRYYQNRAMVNVIALWNGLTRENPLKKQKTIKLAIRDQLKKVPAKKKPAKPVQLVKKPVPKRALPKVRVSKKPDLNSMILVREWIRQGHFQEALASLKKIPLDEFRIPSHKADYYWSLMQCQLALGQVSEATTALESHLKYVSEEALEKNKAQLSPKVRHLLSQLGQ